MSEGCTLHGWTRRGSIGEEALEVERGVQRDHFRSSCSHEDERQGREGFFTPQSRGISVDWGESGGTV
jgi:hypothetical protein